MNMSTLGRSQYKSNRTRTLVAVLQVLLGAVVGATLMFLLWQSIGGGVWRGGVEIQEAVLRAVDKLDLKVASCNGNARVYTLEDTDELVRLRVVASSTPFKHGNDCQDSVTMWLKDPIGNRNLIDDHTGRALEVRRPAALVEQGPAPLPLPWLLIEYDGELYQGRQSSSCWPLIPNSTVCADVVGWKDFARAQVLEVKGGDEIVVVVETKEVSPGDVTAQVFTVLDTKPELRRGEEVYSARADQGLRLDLPPGIYYLSLLYKSREGDISYGFKLEIVDSTSAGGTPASPLGPDTQVSIEAVHSWVASIVGGDPLRPLFAHQPDDQAVIASLAHALDAVTPIAPGQHLSVNDRGRYLSVRYSDGTKMAIRQVARCEPRSDAEAKESIGGRCSGRWVRLNDAWWVEGTGIVESSSLSRWWEHMTEFMAPIGTIGIPKTIRVGEPFHFTLINWDDVIDGLSMNLSLMPLDGPEIELGTFPVSDVFQGQMAVPEQVPIGRYWLRVSGDGFAELVHVVQVVQTTTEPSPPTAVPTSTATPAPFSAGSASKVPEHIRLDLDDGIVVAFADDPALGRIAYVTHVASGSQLVLDAETNVTERYDSPSNYGRLLDLALADSDSMAQVLGGLRYPGPLPRNPIADWINLIQFSGVQYGLNGGRQLDGSQLGPLVYRVAFSLDANLLPNDYQIQDGDAAFLKLGTAIHIVIGYDPSKWLAAIVDGEVMLFESLGQTKPLEQ